MHTGTAVIILRWSDLCEKTRFTGLLRYSCLYQTGPFRRYKCLFLLLGC